MARLANSIRNDMFATSVSFTGQFGHETQIQSVPQRLLVLVNMIINGPNTKDQAEQSNITQPVLTVAQLLMGNAYKQRRKPKEPSTQIYVKNRQMPLSIYVGMKMHSLTRKRQLVDSLHELGLSESYDSILDIKTSMANNIINHYSNEGVVCPPQLRTGEFVVGAADNIDHNPSSTTSIGSFHGTGTADSFLTASHVTRTRNAHQVTACALHILMTQAYTEAKETDPDIDPGIDFDAWCALQKGKSPQFLFWTTCLDLQLLVFAFVRAIRTANFELYVSALNKLVPWFFTFNHTHYARWISVHLRDMMILSEKHPDVYQQFKLGKFVVAKSIKFKPKGKEMISELKSEASFFSRLYVSCQRRDGNMDEFFRHEHQPFPPSLSTSESLRQSNKSDLVNCLEELMQSVENRHHMMSASLTGL
ncbi:hypothetical protein ElyMa_006095400 [Elysia marginata]|uniref:Uncharacterized protein n=1 Tax=Elysia marginata TaxID=1093978 RepID=A0AAV4GR02_9GAST|nr:hypothetical protein ElyMa_006095400 [Elysia marginata]